MSEWKTYKLSEIAQMIGDGTPRLSEVFIIKNKFVGMRCANVSDFAPIPIGNKHKSTI